VLNGGLAASRVMEMRGPTMIEHNFQPGFRVNLHRKDLGIAMATGKEYEVPLPVSALVGQLFDAPPPRGAANSTTPPCSPSSRSSQTTRSASSHNVGLTCTGAASEIGSHFDRLVREHAKWRNPVTVFSNAISPRGPDGPWSK
jgi:hypothetical protein